MIVEPLPIRGAAVLRSEVHRDDRGTFLRVFDVQTLSEHGLDSRIAQVSSASNRRLGTLRGLHYQTSPHEEAKTLWCSAGAVFDVMVDLRPDEPTYGTWVSITLSASEPTAVHVPRGVAHGYQTLVDDSVLHYLISGPFVPASARSLLWRDPSLAIAWPLAVSHISSRDDEAPAWPPSP